MSTPPKVSTTRSKAARTEDRSVTLLSRQLYEAKKVLRSWKFFKLEIPGCGRQAGEGLEGLLQKRYIVL
jgi:hypothetical protein